MIFICVLQLNILFKSKIQVIYCNEEGTVNEKNGMAFKLEF
jgi:hypothetical protein